MTTSGAPPRIRSRWWPYVATVRYIVLFALVCLFLIPVYVLVVTAMKDPAQVSPSQMWQLPDSLSLDTFADVWPVLEPGFRNSVLMAVPASIISSLLGAANGFVLAKWRFPGADVVFPLILFGMFIPYQAILIPMRELLTDWNLVGGLSGLILVHIIYGLPITTLIFRSYFVTISDELIDSAQVDGAGMIRTLAFVALPIALPAFAVSVIWQFTSAWNDFLFGLVLTSTNSWPVTVALNNIAGGQVVPFHEAMASALLASIPTLLVYILMGRFFMRGLMAGALKG
ncbi:carbohydrate ABC transporter permease [Jiangella rhizosphaerae]|uniref:Carbohydrate ABC transporter permease n=1 Tax=Jiangella rhizosphaerae TaxID=2293569 RepID=A0A418KRM0_9ACTN|nr:carbohydrate ABC transporter permease [Jiangella rhizosphaerae]RIQ25238.1 carbohydrate ABC transporter permease [Jiangella rhizosphaerae]